MDNIEISTITTPKISMYDLANFLTISLEDDLYRYNINRTIYFKNAANLAPINYFEYTVGRGDTWTNISYKVYGTYRLWWLICKTNSIVDPTVLPVEGVILKILSETAVNTVLRAIRS